MSNRIIFALVVACASVLAASSLSEAEYIPFSGSGTSGTISTPPGSISWNYPGAEAGDYAWGSPGLFDGELAWPGASSESEFTITFSGLPAGVTIDPIDTTNGGSSVTTRFDDTTTGFAWNGSITGGGDTVTFIAPTGEPLSPGNEFFVNVVFSGSAGSSVNFTGAFDPQLAVPLPSAFSMAGVSMLLGFGYFSRNRRKAKLAI